MNEGSVEVIYTISFVVYEFLQFDFMLVMFDFLNVFTTEENLKNHLQLTWSGPDDVFLAFPDGVLIR